MCQLPVLSTQTNERRVIKLTKAKKVSRSNDTDRTRDVAIKARILMDIDASHTLHVRNDRQMIRTLIHRKRIIAIIADFTLPAVAVSLFSNLRLLLSLSLYSSKTGKKA